jgi:hypothetical protein
MAGKGAIDNEVVSKKEIDEYLARVDEPSRSTLQKMRETIVSSESRAPGAARGGLLRNKPSTGQTAADYS